MVIHDKETRWYREKMYKAARGTQLSIKQNDNKKNVTETSQASALCKLMESSDKEATNYVDVDDIPLSDISLSDYNSSDDYESDPDNISLLM